MADGLNNARALRVLELMNDFRTLQVHIRTHLNRVASTPPAPEERSLLGYQLLSRSQSTAQALLNYSPTSQGVNPGEVSDTEAQKTALQRIVFDAAKRRFEAHKIYLVVSAGIRWLEMRRRVLGGARPSQANANSLRVVDERLNSELVQITNTYVYTNLRNADTIKNYWVAEDPTLSQIQALLQS